MSWKLSVIGRKWVVLGQSGRSESWNEDKVTDSNVRPESGWSIVKFTVYRLVSCLPVCFTGACWTFTATQSSVPFIFALWHCANDAAPSGSQSHSSKNSSISPPSSVLITDLTSGSVDLGAVECNALNRSIYWSGIHGRTRPGYKSILAENYTVLKLNV